MLNVCWQCGRYHADKVIDQTGPFAICPACGHRHPGFAYAKPQQLPLLVISGASGAGKSTVCQALLGQLSEVVLLDSDILWRPEFNTPADNYQAFFETWLRMCKNISQAGRPVVLFGVGMGVPANLEACIERRYLGSLHFLALTCDSEVLAERLRERPAWRGSGQPDFIDAQLKLNRWFQTEGAQGLSPIMVLDTTYAPLSETLASVTRWIRSHLLN